MAFKAAGSPIDLFREHVGNNPGSFSTTANTTSDFFPETSRISGMPARLTHVADATAYGTQPLTDSWLSRVRWGWSPNNTKSDGQAGGLT